jgi:hypothetical protein
MGYGFGYQTGRSSLRRGGKGSAPRRGNIFTRSVHPLNQGAISVDYEVTEYSFINGDSWARNPRFLYDNYYQDGNNGGIEVTTDGTNNLTPYTLLGHAIRWTGQDCIFSSDAPAVINPGDWRWCSPFAGVAIPPRTQVWVKTFKQHTVGGRRVLQYYPWTGRGEGLVFTASLSNAQGYFNGSTALPSGDSSIGSGPSMVVADVDLPGVIAFGDSLFDGSNDDANADGLAGARTGGDAYFHRGYLTQSVASLMGCPVHRAGRGGTKFEAFLTTGWTRRKAAYQALGGFPFSEIWISLGTNNLSETLAACISKADAVLAEIKAAFPGVPVRQIGMMPGSSGPFDSLASQTRRSNYTVREGLRDHWLAQVVSGDLDDFWDPSLHISGTGADLWKWAPYNGLPTSDDGTHYTAVGAPLLADKLRQAFQLVPYVPPVVVGSKLLLEDGSATLLEDGSFLLLE